jgi:5-methylcytosine-specific restriction endonuclease McrA
MPQAALRPCTGPGCRTLIRQGPRCDACERLRHRAIDARRGSSSARGYGAVWRRVRAAVLSAAPAWWRDAAGVVRGAGPLCVMCSAAGLVVEAVEVDHVDGNARNNAADNLRPLCKACHSARTMRDQVRRC